MLVTFVSLACCDSNFDYVTYGSVVKLEHQATKYRLHSHSINWGSGSGQQSVTALEHPGDAGGYWRITEAYGGKPYGVGKAIRCGSMLRLKHANTNKFLHSHAVGSPLSKQAHEISGYDEPGDKGDNWRVECDSYWMRDAGIRLVHGNTNKYLHSTASQRFTQRNCPNCPIVGQQEVTGHGDGGSDSVWQTTEGVFMPRHEPSQEKVRHAEL